MSKLDYKCLTVSEEQAEYINKASLFINTFFNDDCFSFGFDKSRYINSDSFYVKYKYNVLLFTKDKIIYSHSFDDFNELKQHIDKLLHNYVLELLKQTYNI